MPESIFSAPLERDIALFELTHHNWSLNMPGYYSSALIYRAVTNIPFLR
jgi:hypothetical protein